MLNFKNIITATGKKAYVLDNKLKYNNVLYDVDTIKFLDEEFNFEAISNNKQGESVNTRGMNGTEENVNTRKRALSSNSPTDKENLKKKKENQTSSQIMQNYLISQKITQK